MPHDSILETLTKCNGMIDKATVRLDALKYMFLPGVVLETTKDGFICEGSVDIKTVYQDNNSNIVLESYKVGQKYPLHSHDGNVEFLIVTKGKIIVRIGDAQREMKRGECASIGVGVDHGVVAVEDSEIIAVCVPPEKAYIIR